MWQLQLCKKYCDYIIANYYGFVSQTTKIDLMMDCFDTKGSFIW